MHGDRNNQALRPKLEPRQNESNSAGKRDSHERYLQMKLLVEMALTNVEKCILAGGAP
jgi:hypothetical protein